MSVFRALCQGCLLAIALGAVPVSATPVNEGQSGIISPRASLSPRWQSAFDDATKKLERGESEAGRTALRQLLADNPYYLPAEMALGYSYLSDDPRQSLLHAWEVIGRSKRNLEALNLLSTAFARLRDLAQTVTQEAVTRTQEVTAYERILRKMPNWPEAIFRMASQRIAIERLDPKRFDELNKAVAELKGLIATLDRDDRHLERATAHFQLGRAYKHQEDARPSPQRKTGTLPERYEQAVQAFETTLRIDASRVDALGEIVLVYLALNDARTAIATVQRHLPKLTGGIALGKAHEMLGELFVKLDRYDSAIAEFDRALAQNENLMGSYLHLAVLYLKRGKTERAIQTLSKSVRVQPEFLSGHLRLGSIYLRNGHYPGAIKAYEEVLRVPRSRAIVLGMRPSRHQYRNNLYYQAASALAWLQLEAGSPRRALELVGTATQFRTADSHLLDTLGMIYDALGNHEKAIRTLELAVNMSGLLSAHYHLAQIFAKQDDLGRATFHLNKVLSSNESFYDRPAALALKQQISNASATRGSR